MSPSFTSQSLTTPARTLPMAITTYLERSASDKPSGASHTFTEAAVVVDIGQTYTGQAAIAAWLLDTAAEVTYTITRLGIEKHDSTTTVVNRFEGNFPGRSVDLTYRFELDPESGLIRALTITA